MVVVADAFLGVNRDKRIAEIRKLAAYPQALDRLIDHLGGRDQHAGLFDEALLHLLDVKERKSLGQGINAIDDVIEFADKRVNVFAVERGDEGAIETIQRLMRELIGLMLLLANALDGWHKVGKTQRQLLHDLRGFDAVSGQSFEQVEERVVPREKIKHERGLRGNMS